MAAPSSRRRRRRVGLAPCLLLLLGAALLLAAATTTPAAASHTPATRARAASAKKAAPDAASANTRASSSSSVRAKKSKSKKSPSSKKRRTPLRQSPALTQGDATWYTGIFNGFCGFGTAGLPADRFIAAVRSTGSQGPPIGAACGECLAVFCRPAFVTDAFGSFNLDRTEDCQSETEGVVVKVTDICPCAGNEQWCCGR
jgi:hypothetical protein